MSRPIRIGVYADIDANLIDGSSIWLQSLVEVLHHGQRNHIKLVLKRSEKRDLITKRLRELDRVELIDPVAYRREGDSIEPSSVVRFLEQLDRQEPLDAILVRGREMANQLSQTAAFSGRMWVYYLPPPEGRLEAADVAELKQLANSCRYVLCQTEQIRVLLEGAVPELSAKLVLLPPMIPEIEERPDKRSVGPGRRLVYVGKLSASYRFLEMVQIFRDLRAELPELEFHVAGDKIHNPSRSPAFDQAVKTALEETQGLVWHGGISRQEVQDLLRQSDVAFSLRDAELDRSLELSTKVLEYGAAGVPVVLNRTPLYEELLGIDYPLLVDGVDQAHQVLRAALLDEDLRTRASGICKTASEAFTLSQVWQRLQPFVERISPESRCLWVPEQPIRIVVAGHDMKFFHPIAEYLQAAGAQVREDIWEGHHTHDEGLSRNFLEWADVIICEWCFGNAVWYSQHRKDHQSMIVRLHRVEMEGKYPGMVDINAIAQVVFVAPHILKTVARRFAWPQEKLQVIPNAVDVDLLQREKLTGHQFNLGMLGYLPRLKRLDRALDILEELRVCDRRFHLYVKGHAPWELDWVWRRESETTYFQQVYARLEQSPILSGAVSFEPFGPDIPSWLRKIGFLVSSSDIEGNQVAVAEAMASGAVPVVLQRPGASETYLPDSVHHDATRAAAAILKTVHENRFEEKSINARHFARETFAQSATFRLWDELLCHTIGENIQTLTRVKHD